jgi:flagellar hook-associated protein 1 FlgK
MSLFQGIETGKKALLAHQLALNTAGHNIANVNTPGYTRQRVLMSPSMPFDTVRGPVGAGVDVVSIEAVRDHFLTNRWRDENQNLGRWSAKARTLIQIESYLDEPSDSGLGEILNDFWAAWQDLASNPEAPETRGALIQQSHLLTNAFHQTHSQLSQLAQSLDVDIQSRLREINNLGAEIADLNRQIAFAELGTQKANDLRDRRNLLIDNLSQYVDMNTREDEVGRVNVYIGSMGFVHGSDFLPLEARIVGSSNATQTEIVWEKTDIQIGFFNGEMKALFELRDEIIPSHISDLNTLSETVAREINNQHSSGYALDGVTTGINFFDPFLTDADQITLNFEIENEPSLIAVSQSGAPGDGSNALAIADLLKVDRIMNNGTATVEEFYSSMVGTIGIQVREADDQTRNYTLLVEQIENMRQSVQGVSLDEEMANLIKFQHAYAAAARVITFMDEALGVVISGMGVTR